MIKALLAELRHLLLHGLLAAAVWLLPQRGHFPAFRLLARWRWLLPGKTGLDNLLASRPGLQPWRQSLERGCALHQIVDRADYYLTRKYGPQWLARNLLLSGQIEPRHLHSQPAPMLLTPHYGQGFWALYYFRQQLGLPVAWLHLPPATRNPLGEKLAARHARKRIAQVERLGKSPAIPTGGSVQAMQQRLCEDGQAVLAMPDVPPEPARSRLDIRLLGRPASIPAGSLEMAARERIPVYIYTIAMDRRSGKRRMQLHGPYTGLSAQQLAEEFASILDAAIERDPCAWHLWPHLPLFFREPG